MLKKQLKLHSLEAIVKGLPGVLFSKQVKVPLPVIEWETSADSSAC